MPNFITGVVEVLDLGTSDQVPHVSTRSSVVESTGCRYFRPGPARVTPQQRGRKYIIPDASIWLECSISLHVLSEALDFCTSAQGSHGLPRSNVVRSTGCWYFQTGSARLTSQQRGPKYIIPEASEVINFAVGVVGSARVRYLRPGSARPAKQQRGRKYWISVLIARFRAGQNPSSMVRST